MQSAVGHWVLGFYEWFNKYVILWNDAQIEWRETEWHGVTDWRHHHHHHRHLWLFCRNFSRCLQRHWSFSRRRRLWAGRCGVSTAWVTHQYRWQSHTTQQKDFKLPSPLRGRASLQPLPHPQCGLAIPRRCVCGCQRVLQVTLQCHSQCGYSLRLCGSEQHTKSIFRMCFSSELIPFICHIISSGLSNIIGIIVYISANSGDPSQSDNKKSYSYGWSFYFGALSFVLAEMVGVLAVHVFIEKHRQLRTKGRPSLMKPPISHNSSYYRNRYYHNRCRRYSSRSNHSIADSTHSYRTSLVRDREPSLSTEFKVAGLPAAVTLGSEFMLYTLTSPLKDSKKDVAADDVTTAVTHNNAEVLPGNCAANRRTTPVWDWSGGWGERVNMASEERRQKYERTHFWHLMFVLFSVVLFCYCSSLIHT